MRRLLAAFLSVAGAVAAFPAMAALDCSDAATVTRVPLHVGDGAARPGSFGNPWINRHHVYCGDINRRGRAVGFHYRQGGEDPLTGPGNNNRPAARITAAILPSAGAPGWQIYRGDGIEIWHDDARRYVRKGSFSTFFPDNCTPDEVIASIRHAVTHATRPLPANGGRFSGRSGPPDMAAGYCYRRTDGDNRAHAFAITGFLNNFRESGWTINTAYPD